MQWKQQKVNRLARGDLVHKGINNETLVWTDGSKTKEKVGFGVYFSANSPLNTAKCTVRDQTSDNAELQAMLQALKITADMPDIHIITDNESVCILVKRLIDHPY
jgi:ribonuclease HI